jgi:plasmid stabilization system protein ParE
MQIVTLLEQLEALDLDQPLRHYLEREALLTRIATHCERYPAEALASHDRLLAAVDRTVRFHETARVLRDQISEEVRRTDRTEPSATLFNLLA